MIKHSKMNEPVFLYRKPKIVSLWLESAVISQIASFIVLISLESKMVDMNNYKDPTTLLGAIICLPMLMLLTVFELRSPLRYISVF